MSHDMKSRLSVPVFKVDVGTEFQHEFDQILISRQSSPFFVKKGLLQQCKSVRCKLIEIRTQFGKSSYRFFIKTDLAGDYSSEQSQTVNSLCVDNICRYVLLQNFLPHTLIFIVKGTQKQGIPAWKSGTEINITGKQRFNLFELFGGYRNHSCGNTVGTGQIRICPGFKQGTYEFRRTGTSDNGGKHIFLETLIIKSDPGIDFGKNFFL